MRTGHGCGAAVVLAPVPVPVLAPSPAAARGGAYAKVLGFRVVFAAVLVVLLALLFVPSVVASGRAHPDRWLILVINTVFGATGLGWLGCLVWACNAVHRPARGSDGGQSGLNIFVNDAQPGPVMVREAIPLDRLERLKLLLDGGALDEAEYRLVKARLLGAPTRQIT